MRAVMGGGKAEINFSSFLQAPPSAALRSSMTQPLRNVGSHGNPSWVRCSDGCRGCYRGSGRASPGNALKMVRIFAAYLAGGCFLLSALWSCASVRDQLSVLPGSRRDPLAPGTALSSKRRRQAGQPKAALLLLPNCSLQGAHLCSSLGAALIVSHSGCNLQPKQAVTASGQHTAALA